MPNKQSVILAVAIFITGFIISVIGVNVVDPQGDTTPFGMGFGIAGIIVFFLGFVFLFLPEIGKKLS